MNPVQSGRAASPQTAARLAEPAGLPDPFAAAETARLFRQLGKTPEIRHHSAVDSLPGRVPEPGDGESGETLLLALVLPRLGRIELEVERRGDVLEARLVAGERAARLWLAENAELLERRLFTRERLKLSLTPTRP